MNITAKDAERAWVEGLLSKMDEKSAYGMAKAQDLPGIPYSVKDGEWTHRHIGWWTNGFWPEQMWLMYRATGKEAYRQEALRTEEMLDEALRDFESLHHDVGFMWLISSGVHYALEGDETARKRVLFAAMMLAARFNLNGFIRAWPQPERTGWSIIDSMMNLPLLHYVSRITDDPRFKLMGIEHAKVAQKNFIREDGSTHHIVAYNPETGAVEDHPRGQGYASGSSWSRGQGWAIYGFALSYLATGDKGFLKTAMGAADYFIKHMPADWIPPCDFQAPEEPVLKDSCAGAIAASGMLEIARALDEKEGSKYREAAVKLMKAMDEKASDWTKATPAILTMCTSAYHEQKDRHIAMNYADFYFIEAALKLKGEEGLLWLPNGLKKG